MFVDDGTTEIVRLLWGRWSIVFDKSKHDSNEPYTSKCGGVQQDRKPGSGSFLHLLSHKKFEAQGTRVENTG